MSLMGGSTAAASKFSLKSLAMASDYEFLPEGERVFKKAFDQRMNNEQLFAKIEYKRSGHFFEITCAFQDFGPVLSIAHNLYTELIKMEIGDDHDNFESSLIAKLFPSPNETKKKIESDEGGIAAPEKLISLEFKSSWRCHTQDLSMDKVIPKHVQLVIESITHTKLVEDLNNQVIHVHAQCQEDCNKVIHKLDVLRKYHDLARHHTGHLFLTEEKDHYEITLKSLPDVNKKLVETTLLDPVYTPYKFGELGRAHTVRCCPFVHIRSAFLIKSGDNLIPAVPEKNKHMTFDLWSGYCYPAKGDVSLKHGRATVFKLPLVRRLETEENIKNWLATGIPHDPNETMEQMEEDMQQAEKLRTSSSSNAHDSDFHRMDPDTAGQETAQALDSPAIKALGSGRENVAALWPKPEIKEFLDMPQGRRSVHRSPGMQDLRTARNATSEATRGLEFSQSLLDSDIQEDEKINLSSVIVPVPLITMPNSSGGNAANDRGVEFFLNSHCSQSLLDGDIPESDRQELESARNTEEFWLGGHRTPDTALPTIREEIEVQSRVIHSTIKQEAPRVVKGKGKAPASPPTARADKVNGTPAPIAFADLDLKKSTTEFDIEMEANAHTLLNSLRNYHGEISLKCHFGRMLIKPFGPSIMHSLEMAYSVPAENMCDLLLRNPRKVRFTKAVTTLSADVQFLLNINLEKMNRRIWGDTAEWTVTYEYICCDHDDYDGKCAPSFIMEMDANNFETKVKSPPLNFGNINVHCTMRNWDYLISATGSRDLEEDFGDIVHAIKESTYIAPGSEKVSMSFELSQRYQIHFQSIRVRRHSRFKSYDSKTYLNVTEVHNLDFDWEESANGTTFFVTSSEKPNSVWYEIDLESVEAKVAFQENLSLDLAEETEWTAELLILSGVVIQDICIPANYIVTKMDGVGFYNDNGIKLQEADVESMASTRVPRGKRPGYTFW